MQIFRLVRTCSPRACRQYLHFRFCISKKLRFSAITFDVRRCPRVLTHGFSEIIHHGQYKKIHGAPFLAPVHHTRDKILHYIGYTARIQLPKICPFRIASHVRRKIRSDLAIVRRVRFQRGINRLSLFREGVIAKCRGSPDAFNLHRSTTIVPRTNGKTVGRCSTIISV